MKFNSFLWLSFSIFTSFSYAQNFTPSEEKLRVLYNRLNPASVSQHLAFYELYGESPYGRKSPKGCLETPSRKVSTVAIFIKKISLEQTTQALITMINKPNDQVVSLLEQEEIKGFELLSRRLGHAALPGHAVWKEEEMVQLPLGEIGPLLALFFKSMG